MMTYVAYTSHTKCIQDIYILNGNENMVKLFIWKKGHLSKTEGKKTNWGFPLLFISV